MNRLKIILTSNETLHEMLIGLIFANLVLLVVALIFPNRLMNILGVLEGTLVAGIYCIHMAVTIDDALCLDEKGAASQMRKHMLIRYTVVCVVVALVSMTGIGNPIFLIFSCLTVKASAYLQPTVHKIKNKRR